MNDRQSIADYLEAKADDRRIRAMQPACRDDDRLRIEATLLDAMASDIKAGLDIRDQEAA